MKQKIWNSIKITPVNTSIVFGINKNSFLSRKLSGVISKFFIPRIFSEVSVNARYFEKVFVIDCLRKYCEKGKKVLDIGSAESEIPLLIHAAEYNITAFDQREYPFLKSVQGDALQLEKYFIEDEKFDAITSVSTIEHIGLGAYGDVMAETSYKSLLESWKNILSKDGVMILTLPITSEEKRREPGQWVENLGAFNELLLNLKTTIIESRLVIENHDLKNCWEEIGITDQRNFSMGIYMVAIKF